VAPILKPADSPVELMDKTRLSKPAVSEEDEKLWLAASGKAPRFRQACKFGSPANKAF
jgi:hypothetical protein